MMIVPPCPRLDRFFYRKGMSVKTQLKKFMVLSIVGTSLLTAPLASMVTGIPIIDGMTAANAIQSLLQI